MKFIGVISCLILAVSSTDFVGKPQPLTQTWADDLMASAGCQLLFGKKAALKPSEERIVRFKEACGTQRIARFQKIQARFGKSNGGSQKATASVPVTSEKNHVIEAPKLTVPAKPVNQSPAVQRLCESPKMTENRSNPGKVHPQAEQRPLVAPNTKPSSCKELPAPVHQNVSDGFVRNRAHSVRTQRKIDEKKKRKEKILAKLKQEIATKNSTDVSNARELDNATQAAAAEPEQPIKVEPLRTKPSRVIPKFETHSDELNVVRRQQILQQKQAEHFPTQSMKRTIPVSIPQQREALIKSIEVLDFEAIRWVHSLMRLENYKTTGTKLLDVVNAGEFLYFDKRKNEQKVIQSKRQLGLNEDTTFTFCGELKTALATVLKETRDKVNEFMERIVGLNSKDKAYWNDLKTHMKDYVTIRDLRPELDRLCEAAKLS